MLITHLLPKKNVGKLIVCNLILIFLFSCFSFSVFADTEVTTERVTEVMTEKETEVITEVITEMETERITEEETKLSVKSVSDSISEKDLLLIIAVMLLFLIFIAVVRIIL